MSILGAILGVFGSIFVNGFFKIVKGLLTTSILGEILVFFEPFCHFGRHIFDVFESIFSKIEFSQNLIGGIFHLTKKFGTRTGYQYHIYIYIYIYIYIKSY